ncbi:MAG: FixH family protein [Pseudomonadales bacterium]|uniref:Nitrogen fixation protein FixH n=1 Tax=Oleiphilus messinensis TaxID=141451 RepID=A0A1Y0I752_9GAMM|nr:FixH family protein [Oleiphilus messinensis]ARU56322.1 hypothetical protein OLMES_2259 [Oleiphilus messinensis]MCG8611352.1 FixH family protein [Pseudomonadales bacterium]
MTSSSNAPRPWYKQFWPWFLIGIPFASIVYSMFMIYFALTSQNELVNDEYYKDGLAINMNISKDMKAAELGIQAKVSSDSGINEIQVHLMEMPPEQYSDIALSLEHPTLAKLDYRTTLLPLDKQTFIAEIPEKFEGKRYITLTSEAGGWQLKGVIAFPSDTPVVLVSQFQ